MNTGPSNWPPWAEYALAIGVIVVALAVRWWLDPLLGDASPFLLVLAALLVLVTIVRPGPFVAAIVAAFGGSSLLFVEPRLTLDVAGPTARLQMILFAITVTVAGIAAWASHRAQSRRLQVEQQFQRRSEKLRLVTDAMPALISYVDVECRYQFVNARYLEWFGQPAEQVIGRPMR
ncbi:MAG TPA: DUF4118 domain-containing protein, partial [Enhygromyxa sp.]|nr:DUF4118 domain-containing protein [Enhygromyxa sp.]